MEYPGRPEEGGFCKSVQAKAEFPLTHGMMSLSMLQYGLWVTFWTLHILSSQTHFDSLIPNLVLIPKRRKYLSVYTPKGSIKL